MDLNNGNLIFELSRVNACCDLPQLHIKDIGGVAVHTVKKTKKSTDQRALVTRHEVLFNDQSNSSLVEPYIQFL